MRVEINPKVLFLNLTQDEAASIPSAIFLGKFANSQHPKGQRAGYMVPKRDIPADVMERIEAQRD